MHSDQHTHPPPLQCVCVCVHVFLYQWGLESTQTHGDSCHCGPRLRKQAHKPYRIIGLRIRFVCVLETERDLQVKGHAGTEAGRGNERPEEEDVPLDVYMP